MEISWTIEQFLLFMGVVWQSKHTKPYTDVVFIRRLPERIRYDSL